MKSHDPTRLLHGHSVYWSELVGIPLRILWPWHIEWAFTAVGSKLGNPLSLVPSLSSTARSATLVSKSSHLQPPPYPQQGKSMTVLTALTGNSPSTCPLEEKEKLPSQASDKHLPSAHCAVRWGSKHQTDSVPALKKLGFGGEMSKETIIRSLAGT